MKRAFALLACLAAAPALAEAPIPDCFGEDEAPGVGYYNVSWHGSGYVFYSASLEKGGETLFLDHCEGTQRLTMQLPAALKDEARWKAEEKLFNAVFAALESKRSYTMGQIATVAREAGGRTKQSKASYRSCGCKKIYGG